METEHVEGFFFGMIAGFVIATIIFVLETRPPTDDIVCVKVIPNRVASIVTVPCK